MQRAARIGDELHTKGDGIRPAIPQSLLRLLECEPLIGNIDAAEFTLQRRADRIRGLMLALWLPLDSVQKLLLVGSVVAIFVIEIVNSAIEAAIDRISTDRHPLSKAAKDLGSAAVFIAALFAGATWLVLTWPLLTTH